MVRRSNTYRRLIIGDNQNVPGDGYYTTKRPYIWIPKKPFHFGGKQFEANKKCKFLETANFGWIVQGGKIGKE